MQHFSIPGFHSKFSLLFFELLNTVKTDTKITLHHMGIFFYLLTKIKNLKSGGLDFWKVFLPLKKLERTCGFCAKADLPRAH